MRRQPEDPGIVPYTALLLRDMVGTPEMRRVWTESVMVQRWMDVERTITAVQAELGMIPKGAARQILDRLTLRTLTIERIDAKRRTVGHLMVAFLKAFREVCGAAAEHFHVGPTTQDIFDTGLVLQMRDAHRIIMQQMLELETVLSARALEHKATVVAGRSHQQHAGPTTFGLVLATWASEIRDHFERARDSEQRWQLGSLSAAVGTLSTFVELADVRTAERLQRLVCERLGLGVPLIDLHPRTDRFAEVVTNLASLCSSLAKMGRNLSTWQRTEVMEVEEPYGAERYSSSTMPNKVNPESSEQLEGLAALVSGHARAILDIRTLDNRDGARLPVEYAAIPSAYLLAARALQAMTTNMVGLVVHADRMRANLAHPNDFGQVAAERLMIAMYKKTGERDRAHTVLHDCARRARTRRIAFKDAVMETPEVVRHFTPAELEALFDLSTYTGTAARQTERLVRALRRRQATDRRRYA